MLATMASASAQRDGGDVAGVEGGQDVVGVEALQSGDGLRFETAANTILSSARASVVDQFTLEDVAVKASAAGSSMTPERRPGRRRAGAKRFAIAGGESSMVMLSSPARFEEALHGLEGCQGFGDGFRGEALPRTAASAAAAVAFRALCSPAMGEGQAGDSSPPRSKVQVVVEPFRCRLVARQRSRRGGRSALRCRRLWRQQSVTLGVGVVGDEAAPVGPGYHAAEGCFGDGGQVA